MQEGFFMLKARLFYTQLFFVLTVFQTQAMNNDSSKLESYLSFEIYIDADARIFYEIPKQIANCNNILILEEGKKIKENCPFVQVSAVMGYLGQSKRFPYPVVGAALDIYRDGLPLCLLNGKKNGDTIFGKVEKSACPFVQVKEAIISISYIIRDNPDTKQSFKEALEEKLEIFRVDPLYGESLPASELKRRRTGLLHYKNFYMLQVVPHLLAAGIIEENKDTSISCRYNHGPNGYFAKLAKKKQLPQNCCSLQIV